MVKDPYKRLQFCNSVLQNHINSLKYFWVFLLNCKIRHAPSTWKELIRKSLCLPIFRNITEIVKKIESLQLTRPSLGEIGHTTGVYVPHSFRTVVWVLLRPTRTRYSVKVLWDGTYAFSSLSEKTGKSNCLQDVTKKTALSSQLLKDPECWSGRGLNPRPPAQQTGALPSELTRRRWTINWTSFVPAQKYLLLW